MAFVCDIPYASLCSYIFQNACLLIGAALIGTVCTVSYLRSGSIWLPVVLHWLIVVAWLLVFGGLEKFQS
ncbi:MAG: CPBP family intramembrane metalloprotease [Leptolyngbyaceae cyanobacterium SM1_4_3]|nr:CPBP family intramembrane metalloprotease [Leptolyngbyaceae cyanobacterium SM1_4_3]